jgi:NAD(P)-dependent dehydrogenase (short-subunit alcohol dehydrogenase family)
MEMAPNLLIVGAGSGFARASARRFGADGYQVHLIARSAERIADVQAELAAEGIDARTYPADVTSHADLTGLIADIDRQYPVNVGIFQPGGPATEIVDVLDATAGNVRPHLDLLVLGAVAVGQALVPAMIDRGSGCLVFVGGGSARLPLREFGNLGMAMSGLRAYALTLHAALADKGVHAAFYTVAGMIGTGEIAPGEIDPAELAERMRALAEEPDVREVLMTPGGEVVPKGAR